MPYFFAQNAMLFYKPSTTVIIHIQSFKQYPIFFLNQIDYAHLGTKKAILADGFKVMVWLRPLVVKLEVKSKSAQFMHEYIE